VGDNKDEGSPSMKMFGAVARTLREKANVRVEDISVETDYSISMVHKIERGDRMPPPKFLAKATELYDAGAVLTNAARHLDRSEYPSWFEDYVELERTAVSVSAYDAMTVNALLQTGDYARQLLGGSAALLDTDEIERLAASLAERQQLLTRTPSCRFAFLVEEAALRHMVGGKPVQQGQLTRLLEAGGLRNVAVQVIPTTPDVHPGYDGPLTLLETADRQLLAYLEIHARSLLIDDREEVGDLNQRYGLIRSHALSVRESAKLIEEILSGL